MASWNDKTYTTIVEKYPELEGKTENVAFCVWAYEQNPDLPTSELQAMAESTGLKVAGRAVGSARQIVGLQPKTQKRKAGKKRRGRKKKTKATRRGRSPATAGGSGFEGLTTLVDSLRTLEKDHQRLRTTLLKVRDLVDSAL